MDSLPVPFLAEATRRLWGQQIWEDAIVEAGAAGGKALVAAVARKVCISEEAVLEAYGTSIAMSFCEKEARPPIVIKADGNSVPNKSYSVSDAILMLGEALAAELPPKGVCGSGSDHRERWELGFQSISDMDLLNLCAPKRLRPLAPLFKGAVLALCRARCGGSRVSAELIPLLPSTATAEGADELSTALLQIRFGDGAARCPGDCGTSALGACTPAAAAVPGLFASLLARCPTVLALDSEMRVLAVGSALLAAAPALRPGADASRVLSITEPQELPLERAALLRVPPDAPLRLAVLPASGPAPYSDERPLPRLRGTLRVIPGQPAGGEAEASPESFLLDVDVGGAAEAAQPSAPLGPAAAEQSSATWSLTHQSGSGSSARHLWDSCPAAAPARRGPCPARNGSASLVRQPVPISRVTPAELSDGNWGVWSEILFLLPSTVRSQLDDRMRAAVEARDLMGIQLAAHALKGAAESCCANSLAEACFDLENFAAAYTGYTGVRSGAAAAAADSPFVVAALDRALEVYIPRIEQLAAAVVERISALESLSEDRLAQHLAAVEGYPESIAIQPSSPKAGLGTPSVAASDQAASFAAGSEAPGCHAAGPFGAAGGDPLEMFWSSTARASSDSAGDGGSEREGSPNWVLMQPGALDALLDAELSGAAGSLPPQEPQPQQPGRRQRHDRHQLRQQQQRQQQQRQLRQERPGSAAPASSGAFAEIRGPAPLARAAPEPALSPADAQLLAESCANSASLLNGGERRSLDETLLWWAGCDGESSSGRDRSDTASSQTSAPGAADRQAAFLAMLCGTGSGAPAWQEAGSDPFGGARASSESKRSASAGDLCDLADLLPAAGARRRQTQQLLPQLLPQSEARKPSLSCERRRPTRSSFSDNGLIDARASRFSSTLAPHQIGGELPRLPELGACAALGGLLERLAARATATRRSEGDRAPTVMCVDDNPMMSVAFQQMLSAAGFAVVSRACAEQALEYLKRPESELPDVILLDIFFGPGQMTGLQFSRELRAQGISPAILPIITMSSHTGKTDLIKSAYESGANDWMSKPAHPSEVVARVREQVRMLNFASAEADARMLRHFLPNAVIKKLKDGGSLPFTEHVPQATILFADIVGFTSMCDMVPAKIVVNLLHRLFSAFDEAAGPLGVFKVDTIGDCYVCSTGCALTEDEPRAAPARRMLRFAEELLRITASMPMIRGCDKPISMRVGMHTGPVIATAMGVKSYKFTYIGDTMNTASRMESHGKAGCVHLSAPCFDALVSEGAPAEDFVLLEMAAVKGKGLMQTYVAKVGNDWAAAAAAARSTSPPIE